MCMPPNLQPNRIYTCWASIDAKWRYLRFPYRSIADAIKYNGYNSLSYNYIKGKQWKNQFRFSDTNETFAKWSYQGVDNYLCKEIKKHLAIVTVMFDKETYVRTKTSLRVSFNDMLAAFGKSSPTYHYNNIAILTL